MKKILGLTLALTLALSMSAVAAEKGGTVKSIDPATNSFTLEDGTQLTVSQGTVIELAPGEKVRAAYEVKGGKNMVVEINRMTTGPDGQLTTAIDRLNQIEGE